MNPQLSPDQRAALALKAMTQDEKFQLISVQFGDTENGHIMSPGALGSAGYAGDPRLGIPALQESDAGLGVAKPLKLRRHRIAVGPGDGGDLRSRDRLCRRRDDRQRGAPAGFNVLLAGGVDLVRDPRNGRNFEYAGEDPLLAGADRRQGDPRHPEPACRLDHQALRAQRPGDRPHDAERGYRPRPRRAKRTCWPSRSPSRPAIPAR